MNGLTEIFDISNDGTIAYVSYDKGEQQITITKGDEISNYYIYGKKTIQDIAFSRMAPHSYIALVLTTWKQIYLVQLMR